MIVQVDIGILQTWIIIGLTIFTGICGLTTVGIRVVTKPMVTALKELNITVKEINAESKSNKERISDLETIHRLRGCDQAIKD